MADTTFKPFDEVKEQLSQNLAEGMVIDDDKMGDLKKAYEAANGDLSKIDLSLYSKPKEDTPAKPAVVNQEPAQQSEAPKEGNWKEDVLKEWQQWADKQEKVLATYNDPDHPENLSFRIYANKEAQAQDNYEADFSYSGPRNVTLKGKDGQVPADEYFDELVAQLKAANGPQIEFGNIRSDEFKAKLLAACLRDKDIVVVNGPNEQEIAGWDKGLQEKVAKATAERENASQEEKSKSPLYDAAKNIVKTSLEDKKELDLEKLTPEDKVLYMAAAMDVIEEMNQGKQIEEIRKAKEEIVFKGALKYDEAGKFLDKLPEDERKAAQKGLKSYTFMALRNIGKDRVGQRFEKDKDGNIVSHEDKPAAKSWKEIDAQQDNLNDTQKKLRNLRLGVRNGDAKAKEEMDKRRAQTMTDEFKYVREVEMSEDGKTPKVDEKNKPVYKKDKDGNFVYQTDEKGSKIETDAYKAFKQRLNSYGNTK